MLWNGLPHCRTPMHPNLTTAPLDTDGNVEVLHFGAAEHNREQRSQAISAGTGGKACAAQGGRERHNRGDQSGPKLVIVRAGSCEIFPAFDGATIYLW